MRGQASLELLLLLSVLVAVLYISLSLLGKTYSLGASAIESSSAKSLLQEIAATANEACAMGDGNSRVLSTGQEFSLEYSRGLLFLPYRNGKASAQVRCEIQIPDSKFPAGQVLAENRQGIIFIGKSPE